MIGAAAADFAFQDIGIVAGKLYAHRSMVQALLTSGRYPAIAAVAIIVLCLFATG